jgi:hypothetical protein
VHAPKPEAGRAPKRSRRHRRDKREQQTQLVQPVSHGGELAAVAFLHRGNGSRRPVRPHNAQRGPVRYG